MNAEIVRNPFLVSGTPLPWPSDRDDAIKLACVARLDTGEKGQDILLHVLAREPWRSRNLFVSFFGAGSNGQGLRDLARRLALQNVVFPGFVSDVESIWKTHHALVLPSRAEGLPISLIEAMMCGRFAIVTNEGGNSEVVEEGRTGFIANSAKVDEFDSAMERAWAVREQWECFGKAAGMSVRTMVPLDPVASFTSRLLGLVESLKLPRENAYAYTHRHS
jgi:glycosyltransferase involved in cell wall biosynthesis